MRACNCEQAIAARADHDRVVADMQDEIDRLRELSVGGTAEPVGHKYDKIAALTERLREARELLQVAHRVCTEDDPGDAARIMIDAFLVKTGSERVLEPPLPNKSTGDDVQYPNDDGPIPKRKTEALLRASDVRKSMMYWHERCMAAEAREELLQAQVDALSMERDTYQQGYAAMNQRIYGKGGESYQLAAATARCERYAWKPIDSAPRSETCMFWVRPGTIGDNRGWFTDTSGKPIVGTGEPRLHIGQYGTWSSLSVATHWMPIAEPDSENDAATEQRCPRGNKCGNAYHCADHDICAADAALKQPTS